MASNLQEPATQIQRAAAEHIRRRREQRAAEAQRQGPDAADRVPHSVLPDDSRRVQGAAGPSGLHEGFASWAGGASRAMSSDAKRQRQEANAVGAEVVAEDTSGAQQQIATKGMVTPGRRFQRARLLSTGRQAAALSPTLLRRLTVRTRVIMSSQPPLRFRQSRRVTVSRK